MKRLGVVDFSRRYWYLGMLSLRVLSGLEPRCENPMNSICAMMLVFAVIQGLMLSKYIEEKK